MKIFVETERFFLREIRVTDIEGMYELDSDPDVHQYLGNKPIVNKDETIAIINSIRQQYVDHKIGRWAIIDKKTNEFIGWTGLKLITDLTNNHVNYYDIGYRLLKKHWGKGIATETAMASLNYAFDEMKINEVYAIADKQNDASNKILKKIGLHFIENFNLNGIEHHWYKIKNPEYEN